MARRSNAPNFMLYTRADGSTFIVGWVLGVFVIVGEREHYQTRREAVAAGRAVGCLVEVDVRVDD